MCHRYEYKDCEVKQQVREMALNRGRKRKPAKVYFCLPARECLCVKTALNMGAIDTNTVILFVERDWQDYNTIKATLAILGFTHVEGYCGNFGDCSFDYTGKIDFAFLDLCGEYKADVSDWLYENRQHFAKGAIVSITTQANSRSQNRVAFWKEWRQPYDLYLEEDNCDRPKSVCKLGAYPPNHTGNYFADFYALMIHWDLCQKTPSTKNHFVQQILYRSPNKKQNMAVTTIKM